MEQIRHPVAVSSCCCSGHNASFSGVISHVSAILTKSDAAASCRRLSACLGVWQRRSPHPTPTLNGPPPPLPAPQTTNNVLQIFSVHPTRQPAVSLPAASQLTELQAICRVAVNVRASQTLRGAVPATQVLATSAAVILGLQDGSLASYSWNAQVSNWALSCAALNGHRCGSQRCPAVEDRS